MDATSQPSTSQLSKGKAMNVSCVASKPVAIANRGDSIDRSLQQMWRLRCEHLPVVERGELVGMLSKRDILLHSNIDGYAAHELKHCEPRRLQGYSRVDDFMTTPVVTMLPSDPLELAAKIMLRESIHAVPVARDRFLFGIVTESDLLGCYLDERSMLYPSVAQDKLSEWMSTNIFSVGPDELLPAIIRIMRDKQVRHVPVVEDKDQLLGIVSEGDVLLGRNVAKRQDSTNVEDFAGAESSCAADLMQDEPSTLGLSATLADAAAAMVSKSVSCIPVENDGRLVGVITSSDLLRHLAK